MSTAVMSSMTVLPGCCCIAPPHSPLAIGSKNKSEKKKISIGVCVCEHNFSFFFLARFSVVGKNMKKKTHTSTSKANNNMSAKHENG